MALPHSSPTSSLDSESPDRSVSRPVVPQSTPRRDQSEARIGGVRTRLLAGEINPCVEAHWKRTDGFVSDGHGANRPLSFGHQRRRAAVTLDGARSSATPLETYLSRARAIEVDERSFVDGHTHRRHKQGEGQGEDSKGEPRGTYHA